MVAIVVPCDATVVPVAVIAVPWVAIVVPCDVIMTPCAVTLVPVAAIAVPCVAIVVPCDAIAVPCAAVFVFSVVICCVCSFRAVAAALIVAASFSVAGFGKVVILNHLLSWLLPVQKGGDEHDRRDLQHIGECQRLINRHVAAPGSFCVPVSDFNVRHDGGSQLGSAGLGAAIREVPGRPNAPTASLPDPLGSQVTRPERRSTVGHTAAPDGM